MDRLPAVVFRLLWNVPGKTAIAAAARLVLSLLFRRVCRHLGSTDPREKRAVEKLIIGRNGADSILQETYLGIAEVPEPPDLNV